MQFAPRAIMSLKGCCSIFSPSSKNSLAGRHIKLSDDDILECDHNKGITMVNGYLNYSLRRRSLLGGVYVAMGKSALRREEK